MVWGCGGAAEDHQLTSFLIPSEFRKSSFLRAINVLPASGSHPCQGSTHLTDQGAAAVVILEGHPWKPGSSLPRRSLCLESGPKQESWKERKVGRFHACSFPAFVSLTKPVQPQPVLGRCGYWQMLQEIPNWVLSCWDRQVTLTGTQICQEFRWPRR